MEINEKGKFIYMDDSVDIGKEAPPIPEENRQFHEQVKKKIRKKYLTKAPTV